MQMADALKRVGDRLDAAGKPAIDLPKISSFRQFLVEEAWVRTDSGQYVRYNFQGRPVLERIVDLVDFILGSYTGTQIPDATLDIGGGAQWGKTVLAQLLFAYLLSVKWLNVGYYLPDDDLVQGLIDTKFRPDVVDQIEWFADLLTVGKDVSRSGRQVNRKGAMQVTDGIHSAMGYFRGMGKIPTSFSMSVVITDERDDIPEGRAKYLSGRMTSSDLRFSINIGTMRYDGAGQNAQYAKGTQEICIMRCPDCASDINPEENWPDVCRIQMGERAETNDPKLNMAGMFIRPGEENPVCGYEPAANYYLACPHCGTKLDREGLKPENWVAQRPESAKKHRYSIRVAQMGTPAIGLVQIVKDWCENAVKDAEAMNAFNCDRCALPKSSDQAIDEAIVQRSRNIEEFDFELSPRDGCTRFAGMDTGNRCWFTGIEVESELAKRIFWAEMMSVEKARTRAPQLMQLCGISCLFIDAGPERDLAAGLALDLNGLRDQSITINSDSDYIRFNTHCTWDGPNKRWLGLRCATVEFSMKPGAGIKHKLGQTQDGLYYPIIQANREESIQTVVNGFLTPLEGVYISVNNEVRMEPAIRLPQKKPGCNPIIEKLDNHIKVGSRKEMANNGKDTHFVDACENHMLLGLTYASLAELVGGSAKALPFHSSVPDRRERSINGMGQRSRHRNRTGVIG
jgi:hypothetical protein